ncbi:universal stress protein [Aestuariibacter sp. A3R04]|uniref:universal stress protein n=1 Tax=Aestuariibacter sp. A3R04 TaxID=2841571 RepID=UPI001C09FE74|nr:universal stress protein [Aestuariibacter sp. A3R04]MBU3020880.1 universal stress protein [Aestuariibacter sp. A3R04]
MSKGRFSNILCILHDTHDQDPLIAQAMHVARVHQASLTVMLSLDALPPNAQMVMQSFEYLESQSTMAQSAQTWLDTKIAQWGDELPIMGVVAIGELFLEAVKYVVTHNIDLVIKRSQHGILNNLTGSDDRHMLRKCPCPVWIVQQKKEKKYSQIVAAVDVNYHYPTHEIAIRKQLALDILNYAAHIALLEHAQLHIVHVYDSVPENILRNGFISVNENVLQQNLQAIHEERETEIMRLLGILQLDIGEEQYKQLAPCLHLIKGYPRREIAKTSKQCQADAVVMGTLSRLGVPGYIMGGTAEETIVQLDCAVIGLKPEGFVTPVDV